MKEATGELNMTIVVAISIGVLATFFFTVLWPLLRGNFRAEANCSKATCNCGTETKRINGVVLDPIHVIDGNKFCSCYVEGNNEPISCVYRG